MTDIYRQAALDYHEFPIAGKIEVSISKPADTPFELSLAYSPGVSEPVLEIHKDPSSAFKYTGKGNSVAVISNGSAILGLGNLGPLASKPVLEGKCLLFKRFANINAFDLEVDAKDPEDFVNIVKSIACSFGGINLEDIKAPDCFDIEAKLQKHCDIPVFHDDQHGTAIVVLAGILNALEVQGKGLDEVNIVCLGAGAAALACCKLLIMAGADPSKLLVIDSKGVICTKRSDLNKYKKEFASETNKKTISEAIEGSDIILGLAGENLLSKSDLLSMAPKPIVFACSNPNPEIKPELARQIRDDILIATGRSDYPNQVNNVLCFPFLFRGALDIRASEINYQMKIAAVNAIRNLAKKPIPDEIKLAYAEPNMKFGIDYILPKPIDKRLLIEVSSAVSKAATDSGVARISGSSILITT